MKDTLKHHSKQNPSQPIFLLFASQLVHGPFEVPNEYQRLYRNSAKEKLSKQKMVGYFQFVSKFQNKFDINYLQLQPPVIKLQI